MGFFFLATAFTWVGARLLTAMRRPPNGVTPWWPAIATGTAYLAIILAITGVAGWQTARETGAGPMVTLLGMVAALGGPDASAAIGGVLAGMLLHEGFRRTPALPESHDAAIAAYSRAWDLLRGTRTAAHALLAAAIFLAVALLSQPALLDRLKSVDAGGVKLELEAIRLRGGGTDAGPKPQSFPGGARDDGESLQYLRTLGDIVREQAGMIARDRDYVAALAPPGIEPNSALDVLLLQQEAFLRRLKPVLDCVDAYVGASADRGLFAIRGIEVALLISRMERYLRIPGPRPQPEPGKGDPLGRDLLTVELKRVAKEMDTYLVAAQASHEACAKVESLDLTKSDLPLPQAAMAPYLTIAAASVAAAFRAPEVAYRDLAEWHDAYATTAGPKFAWFSLRVLITLANLMWLNETQPAEPQRALLVLERIDAALQDLPLPPLAHYARREAGGRTDPCAGLDAPNDRQLLYVRLSMLYRLLNARIDNPEPGVRPLTGRDMAAARELDRADLTCLPGMLSAGDRNAWGGTFRVTFGRMAFAWGEQGQAGGLLTGAQAKALRAEGAMAIADGLDRLEAEYRAWVKARTTPATGLASEMMSPFGFAFDLRRARQAKGEADRVLRGTAD